MSRTRVITLQLLNMTIIHNTSTVFFILAQIMFLEEPRNVTVSEGTDAFFACTSNDTSGVPTWRIANHEFATSALPPRYFYNGSGLVVSSVDLSLNMTSYSCFYIVYVTEGLFVDIKSTTGFLYVSGLQVDIWHGLAFHLKLMHGNDRLLQSWCSGE